MSTITYVVPGEVNVTTVCVYRVHAATMVHHLRVDGCTVLAIIER